MLPADMLDDKLHEECGVMAVFDHEQAAKMSYLGLYALQHRGQESAGIMTWDGHSFHTHRALGEVNEVFDKDALEELPGRMAIGHVRYSTAGSSSEKNAQPLVVDSWRGTVGIAHNGNLVNTDELRKELSDEGSIFQSSSDTELVLHLLMRSRKEDFHEGVIDALRQVKGAYSMVLMTEDRIVAIRDPYGVRPLSLGLLDGAYVVASETCAFDLIGAEFVRDINPGEMLTIDRTGLHSAYPFRPVTQRPCVFEYVYFSRPDSDVFGQSVQEVRKAFGRKLAEEEPAEADVVMAVPDSGIFAAMGYAQASGVPYEMGIIRNHYIGRTFIDPGQGERKFKVKVKLNPVRKIISGKRIVIVDDSIVRGNTSKALIEVLRAVGAKEVHMRVSSPPIKWSCFYGIDTPERNQLIAAKKSVAEIARFLEVDSLGYLSLEGMLEVARSHRGQTFCTACWDGDYAVDFPRTDAAQLSLPLSGSNGAGK